ncbi:MAG: arylsulfatase [Bacteroidetes bacterium]|nr:arylsulfatase [Bacteroidota bacterium]
MFLRPLQQYRVSLHQFFLLVLVLACFAEATAQQKPARQANAARQPTATHPKNNIRQQNSSSQPTTTRQPNIIYIYADDLGYGELGSYGQQKIKTPQLDQMAREGMRFTQHYSSAPVCAAARCMLLTGKNAGHSYIRGNYELGGFSDDKEAGQMPLPEGCFTLAKMLQKAGYTTGMSGKWGLGMAGTTGSPLKQGFDYYYGVLDQKQAHNYYPTHLWENDRWDSLPNPPLYVHQPLDSNTATEADFNRFKGIQYAPAKMTEKALAFIDKNQKKPFFLYLPYTLPHLSLQVPDEWVRKYIGQFDEQPYYGQNGYTAHQYPKSAYAAMISYLDAQVGIILQELKNRGLDDNTIVFFSSDNGATMLKQANTAFFNSMGGLRGAKMDLYEGGIREPLLVRWPKKIRPGTVNSQPSVQYDMMATFAELAGIPVPASTDGLSLLPALLGKKQPVHEYLYFEYPENGGQVAIRLGDWKGIRVGVQKDPKAPWQLYNLATDPAETNDLAAQQPAIIQRLNEIQRREHQPAHIKDWEIIDPKF